LVSTITVFVAGIPLCGDHADEIGRLERLSWFAMQGPMVGAARTDPIPFGPRVVPAVA
jgi:hypothetical protein